VSTRASRRASDLRIFVTEPSTKKRARHESTAALVRAETRDQAAHHARDRLLAALRGPT
jgi:hypothetical protein